MTEEVAAEKMLFIVRSTQADAAVYTPKTLKTQAISRG
jgi:hypothetical protein